ncbi:hypothetical protein TNCV_3041521 [Trichonephila clavipes]|nr:hypothetical protein TNCV_3041521 [Trichonephila clavipes]
MKRKFSIIAHPSARRVSENAFGILAWRFRVFSKAIDLKPDTIDRVIFGSYAASITGAKQKDFPQATICRKMHWTEKIFPTQERSKHLVSGVLHANTLRPVTSLGSNNPNRTAIQIRQQFMKYFTEENSSYHGKWE